HQVKPKAYIIARCTHIRRQRQGARPVGHARPLRAVVRMQIDGPPVPRISRVDIKRIEHILAVLCYLLAHGRCGKCGDQHDKKYLFHFSFPLLRGNRFSFHLVMPAGAAYPGRLILLSVGYADNRYRALCRFPVATVAVTQDVVVGTLSEASTIPIVIVIIALIHLVTPSVHHDELPALVLQQVFDDEAVVQAIAVRREHVRDVQRSIHRNRVDVVLIIRLVGVRIAIWTPNGYTVGDGTRSGFSHICGDAHGYRCTYPHHTGCSQRCGIARTTYGRCTRDNLVSGDGYAGSRTLPQGDGFSRLDFHRAVIGYRYRERCRLARGYQRLVRYLLDAERIRPVNRDFRGFVLIIFRIGTRVFVRTPYGDAVGDRRSRRCRHIG